MTSIQMFHHRGTESTEGINFSICREVPANGKGFISGEPLKFIAFILGRWPQGLLENRRLPILQKSILLCALCASVVRGIFSLRPLRLR